MIVSAKFSKIFGPLTAAGVEFSVAGTILLISTFARREISALFIHPLKYYLVCGVFWAVNIILFWLAISSASSDAQLVVIGLLNYLWPAFTYVGAVIVLRKRFSFLLVAGLLLAVGGAFVSKFAIGTNLSVLDAIDLKSDFNLYAYSMITIGAISWALYSNYSKLLAHSHGASAVSLFMVGAGVPLFLIGRLSGEASSAELVPTILLICWGGLSAISYVLWDLGMRRGNVLAISSAAMFIPLFSTIFTALFSDAELSWLVVLAALLVVSGAWICRKSVGEA